MTALHLSQDSTARERISFHHNVFARNNERQIRMRHQNGVLDFVNNVVYGWGWVGCSGAGWTSPRGRSTTTSGRRSTSRRTATTTSRAALRRGNDAIDRDVTGRSTSTATPSPAGDGCGVDLAAAPDPPPPRSPSTRPRPWATRSCPAWDASSHRRGDDAVAAGGVAIGGSGALWRPAAHAGPGRCGRDRRRRGTTPASFTASLSAAVRRRSPWATRRAVGPPRRGPTTRPSRASSRSPGHAVPHAVRERRGRRGDRRREFLVTLSSPATRPSATGRARRSATTTRRSCRARSCRTAAGRADLNGQSDARRRLLPSVPGARASYEVSWTPARATPAAVAPAHRGGRPDRPADRDRGRSRPGPQPAWENTTTSAIANQTFRVRRGLHEPAASRTSTACASTRRPTPPAVQQRATQATSSDLERTSASAVLGRAYFWRPAGALLAASRWTCAPGLVAMQPPSRPASRASRGRSRWRTTPPSAR